MSSRLWLALAVVLAMTGAGLSNAEPAAAVDWCGGEVTVDQPDTLGGNLLHIVYAVPSDGPDRFAERASPIATDLAAVAEWWRGQDATREPRFDFAAMPGCATRFGALDITSLRLPRPATDFTSPSSGTALVLEGVGQTLDDADKKYVVFFDSPADLDQDVCGTAFREPRRGGVEGSAVVWIVPNLYGFPGCGFLGKLGYVAATAAHELIHSLGALDSPGPPHPCPGDDGHPCDDPADVLSPAGTSDSLFDYILDAGHDDYYAHTGTWWDVQDSVWLAHLNAPPRPVSVTVAGEPGASTVASSPPGIACPARCTTAFDSDMPIAVSAAPAEGVRFLGFAGDCSGASCAVPLGRPASVTARFAAIRWAINVRIRGRGRVTSLPRGVVACPGRCRGTIAFGTTARLVATPARGYRFVRWSGACTGRRACNVRGAATVTASFRRQ